MNKIDTLVRKTFIEACEKARNHELSEANTRLVFSSQNRRILYSSAYESVSLFFYHCLVAAYNKDSNELHIEANHCIWSRTTIRVINSILPVGTRCYIHKGELWFNKTKADTFTIKSYIPEASH